MHTLKDILRDEQPRINAALSLQLQTLDPLVRPTAEHVLAAGGKRLRPLLLLLTARCLGRDDEALYPLACALEFLHSATLLHDDILDGAELRRNQPAAHLRFGLTHTILAGDALLALGNKLMAGSGDPRLTACIAEAIMRTATGEIAEIAHVGDAALTVAGYEDIIIGKTGWLIQASCQCGALAAKAGPEQEAAAAAFGLGLGLAFQLVDDAMDYDAARQTAGKPVGADLREGKMTMPLLCHLESHPQDRAPLGELLRRVVHGEPVEDAEFADWVERVKAGGGAARTRQIARERAQAAARALEALPDAPERRWLAEAVEYVVFRDA